MCPEVAFLRFLVRRPNSTLEYLLTQLPLDIMNEKGRTSLSYYVTGTTMRSIVP